MRSAFRRVASLTYSRSVPIHLSWRLSAPLRGWTTRIAPADQGRSAHSTVRAYLATSGCPVRAWEEFGVTRESITDATRLMGRASPPDIETRRVTRYLISTCAPRNSVGATQLPATTWGRFRCLDLILIGGCSCFHRLQEATSPVPKRLTHSSSAPPT